MTSDRLRLRFLAPVVALALVATACDGDESGRVEQDPAGALVDAVEALADYEGIELALNLEGDDDLRAWLRDVEGTADGEIDLAFGSTLTLRASGEGADAAMAMAFAYGGDELAELRLLPELDIYVRADLDAITDLDAVADVPDLEADLEEMRAAAQMFGLGDVMEALETGSWIHLIGLAELGEMFEEDLPGGEDGEVDADEIDDVVEAISAATARLIEDVEVDYIGSGSHGEQVRVTTDGARFQSYLDEVSEITAQSLGEDVTTDMDDELPADVRVRFDAWIQEGRLNRLAFDLGPLVEEEGADGKLALLVGVAEHPGGVQEPEPEAELDVFELAGMFMGDMFGMPGEDPFGEDGLEEDPFGEDGPEDDPFGEDGPEDDPFGGELDDAFTEEMLEDLGGDCITAEELDQIGALMGEEMRQELEALIEMGMVPLC